MAGQPGLYEGAASGAFVVSTDELAALCQVTSRTITNWKNRHGLPQIPRQRGRYDLAQVIPWLMSHAEGKGMQQGGQDSAVQRRHQEATARRAEAQAAAIEGRTVHVDQVADVLREIGAIVDTGMDALPTRAAPRLVSRDDQQQIEELLTHECDNVRTALADRIQAFATADRDVGNDPAEEAG